MSPQQLEFARKHGITRCPPDPALEFTALWHGDTDERATELELISNLCQVDLDAKWAYQNAFRKGMEIRRGNHLRFQRRKRAK